MTEKKPRSRPAPRTKAAAPAAGRPGKAVALKSKAAAPAAQGHASVVVVTYFTGPVLWLCLRSVLQQEGLRELIIVNNGNPPHIEERLFRLAGQDSRIRLMGGHGNIGFGAGCNLGAREAAGEWLLLLNPDAILPGGALVRARATLEAAPEAGLLGALHVNPDGTVQKTSARHLLTPEKVFSESMRLYNLSERFPGLNLALSAHRDAPFGVPAVSGAFLFLKTADYHAFGGMDERFFLHFEDMDFCQTVHDKGFTVLLDPAIRVQHHKSSSRIGAWKLEYHKARSLSAYFEKRFGHLSTARQVGLELGVWAMFPAVALLKAARRALRCAEPAGARDVRKILMLEQVNRLPARADSGKTVLVTGATELAGLAIVKALLAEGHVVYALRHRQRVDFAHPRLVWIEGNLERMDGLRLGGVQFDALVHAACPALLPRHLQNLTRQDCRQVVLISPAFTDDHAMHQTERQVAGLCDQLGMALTVLKPAPLYGYGLDGTISRLAYRLDRLPVLVLGRETRGAFQPLHADDLGLAAARVLERPEARGKTYPLPGGEALTAEAAAGRIAGLLGLRLRVWRTGLWAKTLRALGAAAGHSPLRRLLLKLEDDLLLDGEAAAALGLAPRAFLAGGLDDLGEHAGYR